MRCASTASRQAIALADRRSAGHDDASHSAKRLRKRRSRTVPARRAASDSGAAARPSHAARPRSRNDWNRGSRRCAAYSAVRPARRRWKAPRSRGDDRPRIASMPSVASRPISAARMRRPAASSASPQRMSAPRSTTFSPRSTAASTRSRSPSTRASSIGTTASAPRGSTPPVGMRIAVPCERRRRGARPSRPRRRSRMRPAHPATQRKAVHRRTRGIGIIGIGDDDSRENAAARVVQRDALGARRRDRDARKECYHRLTRREQSFRSKSALG